MIKILIISLKKDIERREKLLQILKGYEQYYVFIDAVLGKELDYQYLQSLPIHQVEKRKKRLVIPSEIGCTLSHLKAFKYIIDNKLEAACILEDDVILGPRFIQFIESINTEDQKIIGMMFLFSVVKMVLINRNILQRVFGSKNIGGQTFYRVMKSEINVIRACSYIVSSDFAEKTIQLFESKYFLADEWGYFKDEQLYSAIYISNFVNHPIDLSNSNLEAGRLDASKRYIEKIFCCISKEYSKEIISNNECL
jgi:glycosyl transferase family 25